MTRLLEQAVETVRVLPDAMQDELAHVLLQLAGVDQPPLRLTPEEEDALDESLGEEARGEFASEAEIADIWARHDV